MAARPDLVHLRPGELSAPHRHVADPAREMPAGTVDGSAHDDLARGVRHPPRAARKQAIGPDGDAIHVGGEGRGARIAMSDHEVEPLADRRVSVELLDAGIPGQGVPEAHADRRSRPRKELDRDGVGAACAAAAQVQELSIAQQVRLQPDRDRELGAEPETVEGMARQVLAAAVQIDRDPGVRNRIGPDALPRQAASARAAVHVGVALEALTGARHAEVDRGGAVAVAAGGSVFQIRDHAAQLRNAASQPALARDAAARGRSRETAPVHALLGSVAEVAIRALAARAAGGSDGGSRAEAENTRVSRGGRVSVVAGRSVREGALATAHDRVAGSYPTLVGDVTGRGRARLATAADAALATGAQVAIAAVGVGGTGRCREHRDRVRGRGAPTRDIVCEQRELPSSGVVEAAAEARHAAPVGTLEVGADVDRVERVDLHIAELEPVARDLAARRLDERDPIPDKRGLGGRGGKRRKAHGQAGPPLTWGACGRRAHHPRRYGAARPAAT